MDRDERRHGAARRALALVVAGVLVACGSGQGRPDPATWQARWDDVRALVPPADTFRPTPDGQACEDVLVDLREARPTLSPAPDEAVDEALTAWITVAESTFFECFDDEAGADDVDTAYGRLGQLEAEVDAALAGSDGGDPGRG